MIIELGNHNPVHPGPDERPKVTTVHIPEFDDQHVADKGDPYGHVIGGVTVDQFKTHRADAMDYNQGITHLPGHEALLAITAAWPQRGQGRPKWVQVTGHEITPEGRADDIQKFLSEYYEAPGLADYYKCPLEEAHVRKELQYWTKAGAPGQYFNDVPQLPTIE